MEKILRMTAEEFADEIQWGRDEYAFAKNKNDENNDYATFNYDYWYFVKPILAGNMRTLVFGYYGDIEGKYLKVYSAETLPIEYIIQDYLSTAGFDKMEVYYEMEDE